MTASDRDLRGSLPTIRTVAADAGVSLGTVSHALNHPERVAPETLARITASMNRLGYIPNAAAQSLVRKTPSGVGLIVPDIINELFVDTARGAQISAQQQGINLLLANAVFDIDALGAGEPADQQDAFLEYFAETRARGVLLATMQDPGPSIARVRAHLRPIVVINHDTANPDWCTVLMDNEHVGRLAAEHAADLGYTRILFVTSSSRVQPIVERRRALGERATELGLEVTDVEAAGVEIEHGLSVAATVVEQLDIGATLVLGVTDNLAIGLTRAFRSRGLDIPGDVAIMGMDGNTRSTGTEGLSLTSIELPGYRMGVEALELLLAEEALDHHHERRILPVVFRQGETTPTPPAS